MNNKSIKYSLVASGAALLFASAQASATLITFNNASSEGLSDNDQVTTQYQASDGVTFSGMYLEQAGGTDGGPQGFVNDQLSASSGKVHDTEATSFSPSPGEMGLGDYFLRSAGNISDRNVPNMLSISYDTAVTNASGQIWDIDGNSGQGTEQWEVLAFNGGTQVASSQSPLGSSIDASSLDGKPWTFTLSSNTAFDQIKFKFIGSKTKGVGLAFDNFNTTALPTQVSEPPALAIVGFGFGLIGVLLGLRHRRRHTTAV